MTFTAREGPTPYRVLAPHLTRPSNSEAKVLSALVAYLDPEIRVHLILNRRGNAEPGSVLHALGGRPNLDVESIDVGLPSDPAAGRSAVVRVLSRSLHGLWRERVVRAASAHDVNMVYTSQQRFDVQLRGLISRRLRIPHVVHLQYVRGPWLRRPALERLVACERVVAISDFIRVSAIESGVDPKRISVVRNSMELPERVVRARSISGVVIGQTGRMDPVKGFLDTAEIFGHAHTKNPSTSLLLVGDGEHRPYVERALDRQCLAGAATLSVGRTM
jgi:glycosyltransferase involved in cell wall biosynthesis